MRHAGGEAGIEDHLAGFHVVAHVILGGMPDDHVRLDPPDHCRQGRGKGRVVRIDFLDQGYPG